MNVGGLVVFSSCCLLCPYKPPNPLYVWRSSKQTFCILQRSLLASAIVLVTKASETVLLPSHESNENKKLRNEYCVGFVGMACQTVGLVEPYASSARADGSTNDGRSQDLLGTCVALLTILVSRGTDSRLSELGTGAYFSNVAASIRKYDAIKTLVQHASAASAWATSTISLLSSQSPEVSCHHHKMAVDTVQSIFMFISAVADVGDESFDMLSLLTANGVSQLILGNPLFRLAGEQWCLTSQTNAIMDHTKGAVGIQNDRHLRGYLPTVSKSAREKQKGGMGEVSGRDDPVHEIWRTAVRTVVAMVRSSRHSLQNGTMERMNSHFVQIAMDFLRANKATLLSCLKECSIVPFGENREAPFASVATATSTSPHSNVFTLNVLREACDVLSLVSELCTPPNRNEFERTIPKLYKLFVQASLEMTRSLGQFLGAAGAARELFMALAKFDAEEVGDVLLDSSSDIYPLLEGGMPNARHEAIRNAHYAIRCCALVTVGDFDASDMSSSSNHRTEGSAETLERTCQIAVNSAFNLRMENAAAECLYHAVTVIWKTHPASSSFVVFTPEEASRLDSMSIVKKGMIVALRKSEARETSWSASGFNYSPSGDSRLRLDRNLCFARILGADTIRRVWRVQYLESSHSESTSSSECVVSADLLAGVEDMLKRKCMFDYHYAESASAVESFGGGERPETVGHLILALRWCYQYLSIPESTTRAAGRFALIRCLAERLSVLLGTEVSLHNEIGSPKMAKVEVSKRLGSQLLDLFGDIPRGHQSHVPTREQIGMTAPIDGHREGRLKKILANATWNTLQRQLEPDLEGAKRDREEIRMKNEQSAFGNPSPYRRNTFFRGVSF